MKSKNKRISFKYAQAIIVSALSELYIINA